MRAEHNVNAPHNNNLGDVSWNGSSHTGLNNAIIAAGDLPNFIVGLSKSADVLVMRLPVVQAI
jgi:hypothetical protein